MTACVLDEPFTVVELRVALRLLHWRSAWEIYGTSRQALLNFPDPALLLLLKWFNAIWSTGSIPHGWRVTSVVPILKPGKSQHNQASYRLIFLTSCIARMMKRLVHARLT